MIDFKRLAALVLTGTMSLSLLSGCGSTAPSAPADVSDAASSVVEVDLSTITDICRFTAGLDSRQVVATVNKREITAEEVLYWVALYCDEILDYYSYYGLDEIPWDTELEGGDTFAQYILSDALNGAALYHLLEAQADLEGLSVSQEDLDAVAQSLEAIRKDQQEQGSTAEAYLRQFVLTPELYTRYCGCEYLFQALADAHYGVKTSNYPTDEQIMDYVEQTLGLYSTKHILLATLDTATYQPLDEATVAKKKEQAKDLFQQLKQSSDPATLFDTLMNEYSEDPGLAGNPDGYLGISPGMFDPAYEQAAMALEVGQISNVVEGSSGFHIIQRLPLEVDPALYREDYINDKMMAERDKWMAAAKIQTNEYYDSIDAKAFYNALTAYRLAVAEQAEG